MGTTSPSIPGTQPPASVAVVGAGITGLTAAHDLRARGIEVDVYEAGSRPGGPIRSWSEDGYLAEEGPNTLLLPDRALRQWIIDLGLSEACLESSPSAHRRYLVRHGRPLALPGNPLGWITTPLFSLPGKLRILGDLFAGRAHPDTEESVADFVRRRLGQEMLDYAINPLISGIYAGDPERLSVREAFPRLHDIERRHRSLLIGQFAVARERRRAGEVPRTQAPKVSFHGGLETLVTSLARPLGSRLHLRSRVRSLMPVPGGWRVETGAEPGTSKIHRAVLLAAPAHRLAEIGLGTPGGDSLAWLGDLPHAPITTLVLGFRREEVAHPLDGFGVLVPEKEPIPILGVIFNSSLFPHRAPPGHVAVTCYLGGSRDPELALASRDRAVATARSALSGLLGAHGQPTFIHHRVHNPGIPQYTLGFGALRARLEALEQRHPGLHFAGHFRNGIALADCITAGRTAADRIEREGAPRAPTNASPSIATPFRTSP